MAVENVKLFFREPLVPGGVGSKALEAQLLKAEILQRPVGQFVAAAFVIAGDKPIGTDKSNLPGQASNPSHEAFDLLQELVKANKLLLFLLAGIMQKATANRLMMTDTNDFGEHAIIFLDWKSSLY